MSLLASIANEIQQTQVHIVHVIRPRCKVGLHEWAEVTLTTSENHAVKSWQQCIWCGKIKE